MEKLILLKANIMKKKGTFISIVLLMMIIVTSAMAIFGVRDNFSSAVKQAFADADAGDIVVFFNPDNLTEELRDSLEKHEFVERVEYYKTITTNGSSVGEYSDGNSWFMMPMREGIALYNEELDGFEKEIPELDSGEIYLPLGLRSKLQCEVGDILTVACLDQYHEFVIKGFVQEPSQGSANIGWKQVFIGQEDFDRILVSNAPYESEHAIAEVTMLMIYQADDCQLSVTKFQRQLNLDTGVIAKSVGALTREQTIRYTSLFMEVVLDILLVFIALLFVIVLIVMSHSISTEMEIDYVNLGILKAQGFTKEKIRGMILLQYVFAEVVGILLGCITSVPLEWYLSNSFLGNTAILAHSGISVSKMISLIVIIFAVSVILIWLKTRKISRISPIKAISGGKGDIYFDSRLNAPISKKVLSLTLAFRQFTSAKKRYIGTVLIVAILTFFMLSVNLIGNLLTSRKALDAMGMAVTDLDVNYLDRSAEESVEEIEELVESYTHIEKKYYLNSQYMSVNGENLRCDCYKYPEYINAVLKGRAPLYDNEVVITEMISDILEIEMGDEVVIANGDKEGTYIVSGIYQTMNDSGMNFAISFEGAKKLGVEITPYMGFVLEDASKNEEIAEALNKEFGDIIEAAPWDLSDMDSSYETAVWAIKIIVYVLSVLFAMIVVRMVCVKSFIQERTDIGIYKAIGFTSNKLRLQFAIRFLVIALIGAAIGTFFSVAFSAELIGKLLSMVGISKISAEFTFTTMLVPITVVGGSCFVFAYLVSGKIKKVAVRELVIE